MKIENIREVKTRFSCYIKILNKRFWNLIDNEIARGHQEGFVDLETLQ